MKTKGKNIKSKHKNIKSKHNNIKSQRNSNKPQTRYHTQSLYEIYKQMILNYKKD